MERQLGLTAGGAVGRGLYQLHAYMRQHGIIGPEAHPELDAYAARERTMLIEDINRIRPSVVLVDNLISGGSAWLRSHPDVSGLLRDYQLVETIDGVDILREARCTQRGCIPS